MFGDFTFDSYNLDLFNVTLPWRAKPWVRQLESDLRVLSVVGGGDAQVPIGSIFVDGEPRRNFLAYDMHEIRAQFLIVAIAPHHWIPMERVLDKRLPTVMYDYGESNIECPIAGCNVVFHTAYIILLKNSACVPNAHAAAHTSAADILV